MMNREAKANFSLQFISHTNGNTTYLDGIRMALEGGCRWIQLRMKGAADSEVEPTASRHRKCVARQVPRSSSTTVWRW